MAKSRGLEALAPNGLKSQGYTVSNYPRDNLSAKTRAMLDSLAANPATANIGVKSGYRSPARNAKAGGAKRSQHMKGNAIDLDISGLSEAQKSAVLGAAIAAGAKGIGVYASGNSLHVDPRENPTVWGQLADAYKGMTKAQFGLLPDWARPHIDALFGGFNPKPNPALPDVMAPPQTLAQVQAQERLAFNPPARPLSMTPAPALNAIAPPSRLAPVSIGKVTRAPLDAIPASLNAAPIGKVERAPLGPVGQFSTPATSLAHPVSAPKPANLPAAPVGQVTKGPALAPAAPNPDEAYANFEAERAKAFSAMPAPSLPAKPLAHPVSVPAPAPVTPVTPPAQVVAPAPVLAPALAPPKAIQERPIADIAAPPAAPKATAYDVYSGLADTALDNTGQNTVGRIGNTTTVTNKYGVTTGMTPYGKQTAIGGLPGIGSLPGIKGPDMGKFGSAVKGAIPGFAGSTVGGLLGGPVGALIGGLIAREVTKPGGLLSNQQSFQTNAFGTINAAKAQGGRGFPGAPSGGYGSGGKMGASFSNNSRSGMQGISPGAADAIGRGQGGLY